jgi:hypothetical protein
VSPAHADNEHHDYIPAHKHMLCGPRVYTMFVRGHRARRRDRPRRAAGPRATPLPAAERARACPRPPGRAPLQLYLSNVTKGGQTRFTKLDLNVEPRVGRAVLWPSTLSDAPMDIDERTHHVAMPVEEGIKFSVNLWLHMFDFKKANAKQCTG